MHFTLSFYFLATGHSDRTRSKNFDLGWVNFCCSGQVG